MGIPGQPFNNKVDNINLNWTNIDGNLIAEEFKIEKCILVNDIKIHAFGLLETPKNSIKALFDCEENNEFLPKYLVVPGTGIGSSFLMPAPYKNSYRYYFYGSETFFSLFSPRNEKHQNYSNFLKFIF